LHEHYLRPARWPQLGNPYPRRYPHGLQAAKSSVRTYIGGMAVERIERKESFGECIYCGATADEAELTDEHVVPFSLGGNAVVLKGSCKACAAETTRIENEVGRKVLLDFRTHANVQTRRRKNRPTELPFIYALADGERKTKTVPIADHLAPRIS
jgi:5-methylcytosine-specific restriction endonuclease McrA